MRREELVEAADECRRRADRAMSLEEREYWLRLWDAACYDLYCYDTEGGIGEFVVGMAVFGIVAIFAASVLAFLA